MKCGLRNHFVLALLLAASLCGQDARELHFPMIGVGPLQGLHLRVISLGNKQSRCKALLSFRDAANDHVGPSRSVDLPFGQTAIVSYTHSSAIRDEVRPVVELVESPSSCFAAMELQGVPTAFLAAFRLPPVHPGDHAFASFVEVGAAAKIRVAVRGVEGFQPGCRLKAQLSDERGVALTPVTELAPEPGRALFLDGDLGQIAVAEGRKKRVIVDLAPVQTGSAAGCLAAAELVDSRENTVRHVPFSIRRTVEAPAAPPTRTRTAAVSAPVTASLPLGAAVISRSPLGLPPLQVPPDNPLTAETIALGRRLFYETALSRDRTESCATCHDPAVGFRDPRRVSQGVNGLDGDRQSMTVLNAAFAPEVFWDGRAKGLEEQARGPVENDVEFAFSHRGAELRLTSDPTYVQQFAQAFGPGPITYDKVAKCIAAFQRTALSGNSPFDQFRFGGNRNALTAGAQRALDGFGGFGQCTQCHKIEGTYATLSDDRFHNTGVAALNFNTLSDQGRWKVTGVESDRGAFRPPTLRNVALFARLMHNGNISLQGVVDHYGRGGIPNQWLSPLLAVLGPAPPQSAQDLMEFFFSLTGEMPENVGPPE